MLAFGVHGLGFGLGASSRIEGWRSRASSPTSRAPLRKGLKVQIWALTVIYVGNSGMSRWLI